MDDRILDMYRAPDIEKYEDVDLLTLREQCDALEEQVRALLPNLPEAQRKKILCYLDLRDELKVQTVKAAIRWGKRH